MSSNHPSHINKIVVLFTIALLFSAFSVFAANINKELRLAAKAGNVEEIKRLLQAGAEINAFGKRKKRTALHVAARRGNLEAVKYLVSAGAKLNTGSKKGYSPLHHAVMKGKLEVVEYLISAGADVNSVSNKGTTPLISAAVKGHTGIVQALLAQGADKTARSNNGNTAMDLAEKYEYSDVVKVLRYHQLAIGVILALQTPIEKSQKIFLGAAIQALKGRGWIVTGKKTNRVDAQLKKGKRIYRVAVKLVENTITINFLPNYGSRKLNYILNIRKDLNRILLVHSGL